MGMRTTTLDEWVSERAVRACFPTTARTRPRKTTLPLALNARLGVDVRYDTDEQVQQD